MCEGRDAGIKTVIVGPDAVFVWKPSGQHGHAGGYTDRGWAVAAVELNASFGKPIKVWRLHYWVTVAAGYGGVVLV